MNGPQDKAGLIEVLHRTYVQLSGHQISLHTGRVGVWFEWLAFRREAPFTVEDLQVVINYLWRGIRAGDRNPGALRFSNLIGQPDAFEENLALACAPSRRPPQPNAGRQSALGAVGREGSALDNSGRPPGAEPAGRKDNFVPASEAVLAALRKAKEEL